MTVVNTETGEITEPLNSVERLALIDAEDKIARGIKTFIEVGEALARVRDQNLYREMFGTFEAYCSEKWGITDRRARQMIDAARIVDSLPTGTTVPVNEGQARALVGLRPDRAAAVMREADRATGGRPTARAIQVARAAHAQPTVEAVEAAVTEFPDLAYYASLGNSRDVLDMAGDLHRFRERGELDQRLDNLRRSIAVDRAKRDGSYQPGTTAVMGDDGEYRMQPLATPTPTVRPCHACKGRGFIEE